MAQFNTSPYVSDPVLSVRINQLDHAMVPPGPLDNSSLPLVPVIRIFGPSSLGKTTCLNLHQIYPYFYVDYDGIPNRSDVDRYTFKLTQSLNHAIALSLKRDPSSPKSRFIRAIVLVKGIPFYGFHTRYSPFLKILVADPAHVYRAATLLKSGSVMSRRFRVFETHLSFMLQFMSDFGLYGCGWIDLGGALQRGHEGDMHFEASPYYRQARTSLEIDAIAPLILNRSKVHSRDIHHQLRVPAPPMPEEPHVLSVRELWEDERRRRRQRGLDPSPDMPVDPSDSSRGLGGEWVAEARCWDALRERLSGEIEAYDDTFQQDWESWTMTSFESIEAIWQLPWKAWTPQGGEAATVATSETYRPEEHGLPDVDIDVAVLSSSEVDDVMAHEDDFENAFEPQRLRDFDIDHDYGEDEADAEQDVAETHLSPNAPEEAVEGPANEDDDVFLDVPQGAESKGKVSGEYGSPATPTRLAPISDDQSTIRKPSTTEAMLDTTPTQRVEPTGDNTLGKHTLTDPLTSPRKKRKVDFAEDLASPSTSPAALRPLSSITSELEATRRAKIKPVRKSVGFRSTKVVNLNRYTYSRPPPSTSYLIETLDEMNQPTKLYQAPYYSRPHDVPTRPREYAGLIYHLHGINDDLQPWQNNMLGVDESFSVHEVRVDSQFYLDISGWEYASSPPSVKQTRKWAATVGLKDERHYFMRSQIETSTQANMYGIGDTPMAAPNTYRDKFGMSLLSLEVFVLAREDMVPDPGIDEISIIFFAFQGSEEASIRNLVAAIQTPPFSLYDGHIRGIDIVRVSSELELLNWAIDTIVDLDPDILVGWEVQSASWGYLNSRSEKRGLCMEELISRSSHGHNNSSDLWSARHASTFKVTGRYVLNAWRIMRSEKTLTSYTLENVVFHTLRIRIPKYSFSTLSAWYHDDVPSHTARVLTYFLDRTSLNLELLQEAGIVTKTAEFARVFGVDFYSVLTRGSQFKVESFMSRIAKPENFILISPSREEVGKQNAAECMPLILEPVSALYTSPLLVLDFQSLYPSVMIAYNYCYSTCLGRIKNFKGRNKLGVVDLDLPLGLLKTLEAHISIAPNGIMYVKPEVRKGLLGRMLTELLDTRVMVKQAMKGNDDRVLKKVLDARQLSLKYICNVTYGYTSATFSGRMPAVEIADSIVQSGRETLEKVTINLIESTSKWGAKVVYGDTDSVFVHLPGKTKEQAFRIGYDIADTVTAMNPAPIKLKFDKLYLPGVLMAKKRYVGFKYESVDQKEPVFDAKGIETVRRDGVSAQRKMVEKSLKILFRTEDLSEVKDYCYRTWSRILDNRASIQDFIFAKEVRMGLYSDNVPPPPGVAVAARRTLRDPKNEPQYAERVPYLITRGPPHAKLVDRAMDPLEFLEAGDRQLDSMYYLTRVLIPPLERVFNLVGADVQRWFNEMPKMHHTELRSPSRKRIAQPDPFDINDHFLGSPCIACTEPTYQGLCMNCCLNPPRAMAHMSSKIRANEKLSKAAHQICTACTNSASSEPVECISLDCPWMFTRKQVEQERGELGLIEDFLEEWDGDIQQTDESGSEGSEALSGESDDDDGPLIMLKTP